jgi:hypothetical protein
MKTRMVGTLEETEYKNSDTDLEDDSHNENPIGVLVI